jgi:hypothetical protein
MPVSPSDPDRRAAVRGLWVQGYRGGGAEIGEDAAWIDAGPGARFAARRQGALRMSLRVDGFLLSLESRSGFLPRWTLLIAALAVSGCGNPPVPHAAILGKWKSNARLTLQSVSRTPGMSTLSRAFLKDDFFGHLETEIRENESRTISEKDDYDSGFEPYEVLEVSDDFVRIKAWNSFFQDFDERILYLEGDCYYEIFKQFKFREYFCREQ